MESEPVSAELVFTSNTPEGQIAAQPDVVMSSKGHHALRVHAPRVVGPDERVEYEITFESGPKHRMYSLWVSWAQLKDLHGALEKRWKKPRPPLPSFPGRAWLRRETDPEFMETRRLEISTYLMQLQALLPCDELFWVDLLARGERVPPQPSFVGPLLSSYGIQMIPVSCMVGPDEEVFLGPVVDSLLSALHTLSRIKCVLFLVWKSFVLCLTKKHDKG